MKKIFLSLVAAMLVTTSCDRDESLLGKEPQGTVSADQISQLLREFPERATTVLGGAEAGNTSYLYDYNTNGAASHDDFGYKAVLTGLDHMTNDLIMVQNHWFGAFYNYQARGVSNSRDRMVWNFYYKVIYNMNQVVSQLQGSQTGDARYIKGRSLAMRAMAYMDLIRTYAIGDQGIPYYSMGDREISHQGRMATTQVWSNLITDLEEAYTLLDGYNRGNDKEKINRNVVAGFLARAYMSTGNYAKAAQYANAARQGYSPMSEAGLKDGFQFISNPNWMWGADINGSTSTIYASYFSHMSNLNEGYAGLLGVYRTIDKRLYDEIPANDVRKQWFLAAKSGALPKYSNVKFFDDTFFEGDYLYMRADEFYITEAEALARSGNEAGARTLLETFVKTRQPDFSASGLAGAALLQEIRKQRRIELWGEGGEWWAMKRNNESLVRNYEGSNHAAFGKLNIPAGDKRFYFEIPQDELNANPDVSNP